MSRLVGRILLPLLLFAALACLSTFPLVLNLSSRLPGEVAGDNLAFLWNIWWARQVVGGAADTFFFSPLLFAPFGFNLTLHTHTALQAYVGALLLGQFPTIVAQNLIIIGTLALNGFSAYLFARDRTEHVSSALTAGVVFAASPFVSAHLLGHFSLISVWCLPLFLLCLTRAFSRASMIWSALAGASLTAVAYTDYYYFVYCAVLALGAFVSGTGLVRLTSRPTPVRPAVTRALCGVLILLVAIALAIRATGGFDGVLLGVRLRATESFNLVTVGWLLALGWAWLRIRPRVTIHIGDAAPLLTARLKLLIPATIVMTLGMLPILAGALSLWRSGDYTAPSHFWRSGPGGIDVATLVLGNPFHPVTGAWTTRAYQWLGIDRTEGIGWLGVVPTLLLILALTRVRSDRRLHRPLMAGAAFFIWALGPWLTIGGIRTGVLLPANFFGLVPILSNARMPGRAIVVTILAAAIAGARLIDRLPSRRRNLLAMVAMLFVVLEYLPAPYPSIPLRTPALYSRLRGEGAGTVIELPMGLRDGFGQRGMFDDITLLYQMTHTHPIAGGFAARIPASTIKRYEEMPVVRSLLRLSGPGAGQPDAEDASLTKEQASAVLRSIQVGYVVLDRARATPQLVAFVERALPLTLLASEGQRDLFALGPAGAIEH